MSRSRPQRTRTRSRPQRTTTRVRPFLGDEVSLLLSLADIDAESYVPVITLSGIPQIVPASVETWGQLDEPVLSLFGVLTPLSLESVTYVTESALAPVAGINPLSTEAASFTEAVTLTVLTALTPNSIESASEVSASALSSLSGPTGTATIGTPDSSNNFTVFVDNLSEEAPNSFFILVDGLQPDITTAQVVAGTDQSDVAAELAFSVSFTEAAPNPLFENQTISDGTWQGYLVFGDASDNRSAPVHAGDVTINQSVWAAPTVDSTGDGQVTLSAGANTASAPSAPTVVGSADGSVTLDAA